MVHFEETNILNVRAEALVNSVNLKGVMGKGIALAFKNAFPENYRLYKQACEEKIINIGKLFITETGQLFPHYIINFPTKKHWRFSSKYEYIEEGMKDLVTWLRKNKIKSIGIPPLGSGNGKLDWIKVKKIILEYVDELKEDIEIIIVEPDQDFIIQENRNKKEVKLTPARAMLLYLMKQYQILGYEINFLVVQKLAYFLQLFGEPLKLRFEKGYYGPFASNLNPVLNLLNNNYISFKNKNDNKPSTIIKLIPAKLNEIEFFINQMLTKEQKNRIKKTLDLIEDFETPFGLELLGTIDYILRQKDENLKNNEILSELRNWTQRKESMFKPHYVEVAHNRLNQFYDYSNN